MAELNLALSEDQRLLKDSLTKLFKTESTSQRIRAAEPSGFDRKLWQSLVDFGLPTMRAEGDLGSGATLLDSVLTAEESGRYLASAPVAETLVSGRLLSQLGANAEAWLEKAAKGALVTLALHDARENPRQVVPGAQIADAVLTLEGDEVAVVTGHTVTAKSSLSVTTPMALCGLSGVSARVQRQVLAKGDAARRAFLAAVEEWKLATAAALTGIGAQALEMAAEYSRDRKAFGRAIGSFQGVAHPMADSAVEVDGGRLLVWQAVDAIARGNPGAGATVSMALWWAGQAADKATLRALRTFGGYGASLEYDIQLYYRRAKSLALVAGDPERELEKVADRLFKDRNVAVPEAGDVGITFDWGEKAKAYAAELRKFINDNVDDDLRARFHHSSCIDFPFLQKLAKAGHLYPDVAPPGGTTKRSRAEFLAASAVWDEIGWGDLHTSIAEFVLRMEIMWGNEESKAEIVPRIMNGEALCCLGFSEPQSGSDIFGAKLKATQDGGDWLINGQKIFTTCAHVADYILLLTRTDPTKSPHEGLTIFLAPFKVPGVEIHAVNTIMEERTNIVYFTDMRIPDKYRLGEVDKGILVMHSALKLEHGGLWYHHALRSMMMHAEKWARATGPDGRVPMDDAGVRKRLAKWLTYYRVSEGLTKRSDWSDIAGESAIAYGPMSKLFASETVALAAADLVAMAAPYSLLMDSPHLMQIEGAMRRAIGMTIYGGTSEIHRSLIAEHFLKMPKTRG